MLKNKDISYAAIAGATIGFASFIGNIIRLGYLWDQILIPLIFLGFKNKRKTMPMFASAIVACILLSGYKFYLGFFVFSYYLIAEVVYYFRGKISLSSITVVSFVYIISYFGALVIISHYIYGLEFAKVVYQITGTRFSNKSIIALVLILEPIIFSFCYLQLFELVKRVRIFNE